MVNAAGIRTEARAWHISTYRSIDYTASIPTVRDTTQVATEPQPNTHRGIAAISPGIVRHKGKTRSVRIHGPDDPNPAERPVVEGVLERRGQEPGVRGVLSRVPR